MTKKEFGEQMVQKSIYEGRFFILAALVLLLMFVPWMPRGSGISSQRPIEMCMFWMVFAILFLGTRYSRRALSAMAASGALMPNVLAAAYWSAFGVFIALCICLLSLTNFVYTSLWWAVRFPENFSSRLYERELGYFLTVPLVITIGCQFGLWKKHTYPVVAPASTAGNQIVHTYLIILEVIVLVCFGLSLLGAVGDWMFVLVSVFVTWAGGLLAMIIGLEFLIWISGLQPVDE
jgi:hypothetical protein